MAFNLSGQQNISELTVQAVSTIAAISSLRDGNKYKNIKKEVTCVELSELLSKEFNAKFTVIIDPTMSGNANVTVPTLTPNNPMWRECYREYHSDYLAETTDKLLKKSSKGILVGGISADGKLSGIFSEIPATIRLSYDLVFPRNWHVEPDGVTGIIFHEIGHFVNYLRALTYTCRNNYVLHQLQSLVLGNVSRDVKVTIMKQIAKNEELDIDDDIKQVATLDNDKSIITIFQGAMVRKMRSELGDDVYNARGFEALSDYFATSHGLGRAIVMSLDSAPGITRLRNSTTTALLYAVTTTAMQLASVILLPKTVLVVILAMCFTYDPENVIYDEPHDRFRRIRNQLITNLNINRNKDTDKLVKQIEEIDGVVKSYVKDSRGQLQVIHEYMSTAGRSQYNVRQLNQALEDISSNSLYIAAAKFAAQN